jgi:hypothetical protein
MSELAFQSTYARLLTDAALRHSVQAGNLKALEDLGLSRQQAVYLSEIDRERLEMFSDLLVVNRMSKAVEGLPLTTRLLVDRLREIAADFAQRSPPREARKVEEAVAFGEFLKAEVELPPLIRDVLEYEMASLTLRFRFDGVFSPADEAIRTVEAPRADLKSLRRARVLVPVRLRHHRVLTVHHDLEAITGEIEQGRTPQLAPGDPILLLLHMVASGHMGQAEINGPTAALIRACDGRTPLGEIISRLAVELNARSDTLSRFEAGCLDLCANLIEAGCLELCANLKEKRVLAFHVRE